LTTNPTSRHQRIRTPKGSQKPVCVPFIPLIPFIPIIYAARSVYYLLFRKSVSIVYTDGYKSHDVLDTSTFHHERINHSEEFVDGKNHINGIENFWSQAKRILRKYNGINWESFPLFLKECEFSFNYGTPRQKLKTLRK